MKDLYSKNCKTLVKLKIQTNSHLYIKRINIVKMTILPKAIYRFDAIPNKISMAFS